MSADATPELPELNLIERRILGVLVEKAKTTPDAYPLSLNSLVTGSNQKSNRDPLLNISDSDIEDGIVRLQPRGLVSVITGGRVERWKHNLYDVWKVGKVELAILGELLLRGPQTEGELRGRASRMEPIADLDTLRGFLKPMAERKLVVYLSPENRRGTMLTHGFHGAAELERLKALHAAGAPVPAPAEPVAVAAVAPLVNVEGELRKEIAELRAEVTRLASEVQALKSALGA